VEVKEDSRNLIWRNFIIVFPTIFFKFMSPDLATLEGSSWTDIMTCKAAVTVFNTPDDGCCEPETCRVILQ